MKVSINLVFEKDGEKLLLVPCEPIANERLVRFTLEKLGYTSRYISCVIGLLKEKLEEE